MVVHVDRPAPVRNPPEGALRYPAPHVLLIDAHADTRELYELWLTQRGFTASAAACGGQAVEAARAHPPDVVLVELVLPDGGVSLIRSLRSVPGCHDAVVIVLTAQADAELRDRALEAGADLYLVKPFGVVRLGDAMVAASHHRSRLIVPHSRAAAPPSTRLRESVQRCRAVRERLAADALPPPPDADCGVH